MADKSSFKPGPSYAPTQSWPKQAITSKPDGVYKQPEQGASEEERFGGSQNPVKHDSLPAKNLRSVGG